MSEEAFSVTFVGLFGCSLGFSSMFCTAIVVAGGSWTNISGVRVTFHLISTFLLQELDEVALDFTLTRAWPSTALSSAAIGGAWPPSAAFGRHRRSLAAICGVRPPSAELGRHLRRSAAIGGAWPPSAAFGCHLRHSASIGGAWTPSAALGRTAVCGAWPPSAALGNPRPPAAARAAWLRP
jgi:hypothetical protein